MRVLGRVRLSRATEESTSVERQRELIQQWSDAHSHEIIGWAEDLDISGSVDPFDTPELGRWLSDEKKHDWDILCAWKLDRVSRRAIPMGRMFQWLLDNQKTLICTADSIDLSTPMGRLIAYVIATIAEGELEAIRERTRGSQRKLRELGRWGGGRVYYGYTPVEREGSGWEMAIDPHAHQVLQGIIERVLDGKSTNSIAEWLNSSGELSPSDYLRSKSGKPPKGTAWSNSHIRQQLRSKTLLGYTVHNGVVVRDEKGDPVMRGPALVTPDVFDRIQAELSSSSFKITQRSTTPSPLLGVLICYECGRVMHLRQQQKNGKTYRYYQCLGGKTSGGGGLVKEHDTNILKAEDAEELLEQKFLSDFGDDLVEERVYVPAENHQIELDQARSAVDEISTLLGTITSDTVRSRLLGQISALDSRITQLEQQPAREAGWTTRTTDKTYREQWEASDTEQRRQLLIKSSITARAFKPSGTNALTFYLHTERETC